MQSEVNTIEDKLVEVNNLVKYFPVRAGLFQRVVNNVKAVDDISFIICDEPVSALDGYIQSQVLNILKDLQQEFGLTYLFIAHNLSVVEHVSDRVAVMYLGKMVEMTTREELFRNPLHPYTKALMSAIPVPNPRLKRQRTILKGDVPSPLDPPKGCRFHPRRPVATERCSQEEPVFREAMSEHWVAC